jgi:hypothetical protein
MNALGHHSFTGAFFIPFGTDGYGHPRMKFYIDNHRVNTYTTCPTLFNYTQIQNYRTKSVGQALTVGGWWSRVMEMVYREMSFDQCPNLEFCIKFAADAWSEHNVEKSLNAKQLDAFGGIEGAMLMVGDYYLKFVENDFKSYKVIATESGFGLRDEVLVGEDDEVLVYLTGKPDFIFLEKARNKIVIGDHKTVDHVDKNTIIKFKPHSQTAGYVYATKAIAKALGFDESYVDQRCIISVSARRPPSERPRDGIKKPRFVRAYPTYTEAELEEWRLGCVAKCREIKRSIETGVYVRHENSCHLYGGCGFRGVCSVPPGSRSIILKADFVQVDPWTPYDPEAASEEE